MVLDESQLNPLVGPPAAIVQVGAKGPKPDVLTGTPMPHSPLDLYAQHRFLDPEFWNQLCKFQDHYAVMGGYGI